MKKKLLPLLMALFIIIAAVPSTVSAAVPILVYFNGERIPLLDAPIEQKGRVLVPFVPVFQALGFTVNYNPKTKTISGSKDTTKISLILGNKRAYINGNKFALPVAPALVGDATYVPLSFISDATRVAVTYDATARVVHIGKPVQVPARLPAQNSSKDFRNTTWGMTQSQVKKTEGSRAVISDPNVLVYSGKVANLNTDISYYFTKNKLNASLYQIHNTNIANFEKNYRYLKKLLTQKYGTASYDDDYLWRDETNKNTEQPDWNALFVSGQVNLYAEWETDTTQIYLLAYGDDSGLHLQILYQSKKYKVDQSK